MIDDANAPSRRRLRASVASLAIAALFAGSVLVTANANARSEEVERAPSGVSYVSGGAGTEAVDRLKAMERDFNLKLVFATPSGEYLSDVRVVTTDARGAPLLDAYSEGPLLLAKLPPGTYRVNADFEGQPKDRTVTVNTGRLATLGFTWASN